MYSIRSLSAGDFLYRDGKRVDYVESPHRSGSYKGDHPNILVMHYTAGASMGSSVNWFANPAAKASAHLTIGRDGEVKQSVPFNRPAWHAGKSSWRNLKGKQLDGLNKYSIGIELANAGACVRTAGGGWINPLGVRLSSDDVVTARHRNGPVWIHNHGNVSEPGWEIYPQAQLEAAAGIAIALTEAYGLTEILGHDEIAPSRKTDPGPLFDMQSFRGLVMGRAEDRADIWRVRANTPGGLAIRTGPDKSNDKVQSENLAPGTVVEFNEAVGKWWFVTVLDDDGNAALDGWVYSRYLTPS